MNEPDDPVEPDVGTLAEEADRLLAAVSDWARDRGGSLSEGIGETTEQLAQSLREAGTHLPGGTECRWCPVCRGVGAVRNLDPEVRTHLLVAASSLMQAAAAALDTSVQEPTRQQRVQHIDLDDQDLDNQDLDNQEWEDG